MVCTKEWVEKCGMFEDWALIMKRLGAERGKHWWNEVRGTGTDDGRLGGSGSGSGRPVDET